jgi:hypothetical protein
MYASACGNPGGWAWQLAGSACPNSAAMACQLVGLAAASTTGIISADLHILWTLRAVCHNPAEGIACAASRKLPLGHLFYIVRAASLLLGVHSRAGKQNIVYTYIYNVAELRFPNHAINFIGRRDTNGAICIYFSSLKRPRELTKEIDYSLN